MANHARQAKPGKSAGKGGGNSRAVLTAILLLPVVAVLLPTCVVLLIGMAPTAVAYMVDRAREKHLAVTVGLINFCGTLPGVADLWREGQAYAAAERVATDALFWLTSYGAAAVGWLIYLALPLLLANYYAVTSGRRMEALRRRQAELIKAWGEEVAGTSAGDSIPS
ncbi:MAG: hypothetical protein ACE5GS_15460 [Kiloniellaceae bacterium]